MSNKATVTKHPARKNTTKLHQARKNHQCLVPSRAATWDVDWSDKVPNDLPTVSDDVLACGLTIRTFHACGNSGDVLLWNMSANEDQANKYKAR
jgi:hypothetical protein